MWISHLMRQDLLDFKPYGVQALRLNEVGLNANELPWDPLDSQQWQLNRYPPSESRALTEILAEQYQVPPESLLISRGSDESIDSLMRLFITPFKDSIIVCPPTFGMYSVYARIQGANLIRCPLKPLDYALNLEALQNQPSEEGKLLFICRPNNPTGNCESLETIASGCRAMVNRCMVIVDEAYLEFSKQASATTLLEEFDHLVVLKTLSKAYGLAGLRLGVCIASEYVIEKLTAIQAPYPIATPVFALAIRALQNQDWFQQKIQSIQDSRARLFDAFTAVTAIEQCWPSEANFFFVRVKNAEKMADYLQCHGVRIRTLSAHHCRISVGDEEQNVRLIYLLKNMPYE